MHTERSTHPTRKIVCTGRRRPRRAGMVSEASENCAQHLMSGGLIRDACTGYQLKALYLGGQEETSAGFHELHDDGRDDFHQLMDGESQYLVLVVDDPVTVTQSEPLARTAD